MREQDSVSKLKGVGEKTQQALASVGIETVGDLIRRYPARYDSFERIITLAEAESGKICTLRGCLVGTPQTRYVGKMVMTSIGLDDGTGKVNLVWFRMPYLKNTLRPGEFRIVRGKLIRNRFGVSMEQPTLYKEEEYAALQQTLQPVYPLNSKITGKTFRKLCLQALEAMDLEQDYLPADLRSRYQLSEWNYAVRNIHFPRTKEEMLFARKRLVFDEFLLFILAIRRMKEKKDKDPNLWSWEKNTWTQKFVDALPYSLTDAQMRVWKEIVADMSGETLMNRLIQGDVGSGKTVLAQLALIYAAENGYQGAIMAPTEVLARQHYESFCAMFEAYDIPVRCVLLTGSMTAKQKREAGKKIKNHEVDIVVGTHALIQDNVEYDRLALVITDEQHRFGVRQRERLAQKSVMANNTENTTTAQGHVINASADVSRADYIEIKYAEKKAVESEQQYAPHILVMSATPIPRTLNMALSGIRDMSTLEEPPADRQPVQTYVLEHDWNVLADAMRRELERGGQVYYLHNRVETIDRCAARLQTMLGEDAAIGVAHGRMTQESIDDVMSRMTDGELNVLVCTTIIETGIDLPNANTLIIEDADHMGLAQLHQIRGRVGRSNRRAFAYLTYRKGKVLTEVAAKRLGAIREFAEFGSGFKIAMRDLEIRGAGNILGPEQSGFLLSVGYDMYLKLLEEAVLTEQGQPIPTRTQCAANLSVAASVPDRYVSSAEQRMDLYRRIAALRNEEDADDLVDELIDRYGEPPRQVNNLISVALLRADAARADITDIDQKNGALLLTIPKFDLRQVSALCSGEKYKGRLLFSAGEKPYLSLKLRKLEDPLRAARQLVTDYADGLEGE